MVAAKAKTAGRGRKTIAPRPVLQWAAAGLGLVITLGAGGVILGEALQPTRPVALSVRVEGERLTRTSRILDILVTNAGSETAAAVDISGEVGDATASVTLDYVPGDGEVAASLAFPVQASGAPVISVAGWSAP
jgi:uncharacterized protein (TIGR02588 family)